jgi:murein L,D-transpeptidase YcbB/YkuD
MSRVSDIIVFPYWMVPDKIAVKELLPVIRKNLAYLDANNFEVLDRKGRLVNPADIDWQSMGPGNFPYKLRQSTGCDNSLGIIKINFYSPYDVYLHDTPYRNFFSFYKRYYSHGCIRVEQARELAGRLLKDRKTQMDSLIANAAAHDQQPFSISLPVHVPVMVVYQTAWLDENNRVHFYGDVYGKLE